MPHEHSLSLKPRKAFRALPRVGSFFCFKLLYLCGRSISTGDFVGVVLIMHLVVEIPAEGSISAGYFQEGGKVLASTTSVNKSLRTELSLNSLIRFKASQLFAAHNIDLKEQLHKLKITQVGLRWF